MHRAKDSQDGGVVVDKFEERAALGTLDLVPGTAKVALLCVDPVKKTRLVGDQGAFAWVCPDRRRMSLRRSY